MHTLFLWLRGFWPAPVAASRRERVLGCIGAGFGLIFSEALSRHALGGFNPWFVAPMGASAVLLFAVPSSPLAQPWSILGGNVISALAGVTCAALLGHTGFAASIAAALAIALMFQLRCLHPPGGAVALTAVLGGPAVTNLGFNFVVWPVLLNSALLLAFAVAFNNAMQRRYPHKPAPAAHKTQDPAPTARAGVTQDDLNAVLKARGELLDISPEDLEEIIYAAELRAYRRHVGPLRCDQIMSRDLVTVGPHTALDEAWHLLVGHKLHALPVVEEGRVLVGIVTLHDFFIHAATPGSPHRHAAPATIAHIMTREVVSATAQQAIAELIDQLTDGGVHHIPVLEAGKLVGMLSQSDVLAALYRRPRLAG